MVQRWFPKSRRRWLLCLEFLPREALSVSGRHATVYHYDRDALGLGLAHILIPPYAPGSNTVTCFPRSAAWLASCRPCLLPDGSGVQGKD
jgi:hypothetical protein